MNKLTIYILLATVILVTIVLVLLQSNPPSCDKETIIDSPDSVLELGECYLVSNPIWIAKNVLLATKHIYAKDLSVYIRIDISEKALNNNTPLPPDGSNQYSIDEYNALVREIKSKVKKQ